MKQFVDMQSSRGRYRLVDNVMGWLAFLVAAIVYCSTVEPTASFWDCPEFITTGYKLEVGHPPGAPFFMLTANLFSQFTSDPTQVAYMVNMMSALLSATCILFLFWSITHLVRRLLIDRWEELDTTKLIAIEASGLVGALIYTFSDTFWFSAVEGEVYAYSSAFTAVVFWLILKWEDHADEPHSDRWLILIMYMTGLSIGVHLLNLLCLPAIVLVYYYKRFPNANLKGSLVALAISFVLLAAVLYGVVPGIITVGGWFELFFVNTLHMPFNTGLYIYIVLLIAAVLWAIYETQMATEKNWVRQNIAFLLGFGLLGVPFYGYGWSAFFIGVVVLALVGWLLFRRVGKEKKALVSPRLKNTTLLCMLMLMIGYSTYAVIVIRSDANPPMDQNSPEDIFTLGNYLSRDQYGYRPLLYGQTYASEYKEMVDEEPIWQRKEKASADEPDTYIAPTHKKKAVYAQNVFFPRMYSSDHQSQYESWLDGIEGREVESERNPGHMIKIPTAWENLKFFVGYQCNFMYWRYFLWNFAGRQNDLQGHGDLDKGNWLSGIPMIDNARLGDQDLLPDDLKNNKGHNVYYCLPLILGLIGLFWQMLGRGQKGIKQFWVVFFLFFMTGLAIVLYLNQTPSQPRERDYAYAGSFYAYAIWCGMGVAAIITLIREKGKVKSEKSAAAIAWGVSLLCLLVPIQMASQNWDDHDRSGRYTCRDFGQNYLMSLQQEGKPIIFTNGDNDTFPLWYNQDTEGVRTDVRVCNLSYLQTDWYTDQMLRPAYKSDPVPITLSRLEYTNMGDYVTVDPWFKEGIEMFYDLCALDSANQVVQKNFNIPLSEARTLFGEDPFELNHVIDHWVRDQRDPELKEKQGTVLKFMTTWLYDISEYYRLIRQCTEDKEMGLSYITNAFGVPYNEIVDLFSAPGDSVHQAAALYKFLKRAPEDADRRQKQLKVLGAFGEYPRFQQNYEESKMRVIPTDVVYMNVDKEAVKASGMSYTEEEIPDRIALNINTPYYALGRAQLMMLEMLRNSNWKRPLYVAMTVGEDNLMGLGEYFVQEGLAYRITPFKNERAIDTEKTYENVMKYFKFGGLTQKDLYLDETVMRMCYTHRNLLSQLAVKLIQEAQMADDEAVTADKQQKAKKVLELAERQLPAYNVPHDYLSGSFDIAQAYYLLNEDQKAISILDELWKKSTQYMRFNLSLGRERIKIQERSCKIHLSIMNSIAELMMHIDQKKAEGYAKQLNTIFQQYDNLTKSNV